MRKKVIKITIEIMVIIAIALTFVIVNDMITDNKKSTFIPIADSGSYAYQIEKVSVTDKDLIIQGWFFELKSIENKKIEVQEDKKLGIVLFDTSYENEQYIDGTNKPYKGMFMEIQTVNRPDVNQYFKCEYDYSQCGFIAKIDKEKLDLENTELQVVLKIEEDGDYGILSRNYIKNGHLTHMSSKECSEINDLGTELEKIINEGVCLAVFTEQHAFVFQLGWNQYWILDKKFYDSNISKVYITNCFCTTQFDKLPDSDLSDGRYWSYRYWCFDDYEITDDIKCDNYRVAVKELPSDYSVYWMLDRCTYNNENTYENSYRMVYNFSN